MIQKIKTKKAFVFTIALLLLATTIFSLAILTSKISTESRLRAAELTKYTNLNDLDFSMQRAIKTIFDTSSGIKIAYHPGSVEFTQYLPMVPSNRTLFTNGIKDLNEFIESTNSKRRNITMDEFKLIRLNNITLLIMPQNISYKQYNSNPPIRQYVKVEPLDYNFINVNKYQISIKSTNTIFANIWKSGPPWVSNNLGPVWPGTFPVVINVSSINQPQYKNWNVGIDPQKVNILNISIQTASGATNYFIEIGFLPNYKMYIKNKEDRIFTSVNITLERIGNDYIDVTSLPGVYNITFPELNLTKRGTVLYSRNYLDDECEVVSYYKPSTLPAESAIVTCPTGKFVTGCGTKINNGYYISANYPIATNQCYGASGNVNVDMTVYAICCSRVKTNIVKVGPDSAYSTIAKCNSGQYLLGCGASGDPPISTKPIQSKYLKSSDECFASLSADSNSPKISAYAICDSFITFKPCTIRTAYAKPIVSVSCLKDETRIDCGGEARDGLNCNPGNSDCGRLKSVYPSSSDTCTAEAKTRIDEDTDVQVFATCCLK